MTEQLPDVTHITITDIDTHADRFESAIARLLCWSKEQDGRRYVLFCAAYNIVMAHFNPVQRRIMQAADFLPADGMPIVWLQHYYGATFAERVYAPEVMEALCAASVGEGVTHYLWGGKPDVTEKLVEVLQARFPGIEIAGYYAPPFDTLEATPDPAVIERINSANPQIVWVCLGSGKQEPWMAMYRPHLNAPLILAVGAAFNFISGAVPQAPGWMRRAGLEWLFRLLVEPRHLAKRYLMYNPVFIFLMLRDMVRRRLQSATVSSDAHS